MILVFHIPRVSVFFGSTPPSSFFWLFLILFEVVNKNIHTFVLWQ